MRGKAEQPEDFKRIHMKMELNVSSFSTSGLNVPTPRSTQILRV
jgi:hypothetical protein